MNKRTTVRALTEGAIMVAIAQILSYIKLWEMPWGGSIVLAMVPIILYAVRWGLGKGLLAAFAFSVLQFVFDGLQSFIIICKRDMTDSFCCFL